MRYTTLLLLFLTYGQCLSQSTYSHRLSTRIEQIKRLEVYNNKVVINIDSVEHHDLSFPYWKERDTYYQDDLVRYKYCLYRVLTDSTKGYRPDTARADWALSEPPHPYLFLRDTARLDDLRTLMRDKHPYIRSYTFGALSFRKADNLYSLIVDNLGDTTRMLEYSGDAGLNAYPADLMIE